MRSWLIVGSIALVACDEPTSKAKPTLPSADPSVAASTPPLPADGCARNGSLDGVDGDPSCVLARVQDGAMRDLAKTIQTSATLEPAVVTPGGAAVLKITIANLATTETLIALDLQTRPPGPRTDWSRIAGVPDTKPGAIEVPRLYFAVTTLDSHDKSVDAVPTIPGTSGAAPIAKTIGVRLRGGGKVTYTTQWWAMRIPAPFPPVTDDAGHRFVPKTQPFPLPEGEYSVSVEVPLHGLTTPERVVFAHARVEK